MGRLRTRLALGALAFLCIVPHVYAQRFADDVPRAVRSRFHLSRGVLMLAAAQTTAQLYDGVTTKRFEQFSVWPDLDKDAIGPYHYEEHDPISRALLGPRPTWTRMAPIGAAQIVASAYLGEYLRSRKSWVRRYWWLPQAAEIAESLVEATHNLHESNSALHAACVRDGRCAP